MAQLHDYIELQDAKSDRHPRPRDRQPAFATIHVLRPNVPRPKELRVLRGYVERLERTAFQSTSYYSIRKEMSDYLCKVEEKAPNLEEKTPNLEEKVPNLSPVEEKAPNLEEKAPKLSLVLKSLKDPLELDVSLITWVETLDPHPWISTRLLPFLKHPLFSCWVLISRGMNTCLIISMMLHQISYHWQWFYCITCTINFTLASVTIKKDIFAELKHNFDWWYMMFQAALVGVCWILQYPHLWGIGLTNVYSYFHTGTLDAFADHYRDLQRYGTLITVLILLFKILCLHFPLMPEKQEHEFIINSYKFTTTQMLASVLWGMLVIEAKNVLFMLLKSDEYLFLGVKIKRKREKDESFCTKLCQTEEKYILIFIATILILILTVFCGVLSTVKT